MALAVFPSLDECEVVGVTFLAPDQQETSLRLLVDSGFTGQSSFVLPLDVDYLAHAPAPASQALGALAGPQRRVVVRWRIESLALERAAFAIVADISGLVLPTGVHGLAGLNSCDISHAGEQSKTSRAAGDSTWLFPSQ